MDRNLLGLLVDRWAQLDLEVRAYHAVVHELTQTNSEAKAFFDLNFELAKNEVQADQMEIDRMMREAWSVKDDESFLAALAHVLSAPETSP
jgi:hypothetical protein